MATQNEKPKGRDVKTCNMVHLAGEIQSMKVRENGAFMLIDPTGETKYIPCTIYDSAELAQRLGRFAVGDVIQIRGFVRAWSQKKNETWENHCEVRITEIANEPPARAAAPQRQPIDDDIPF